MDMFVNKEWPLPTPCGTRPPVSLPPVIFKFVDGKTNFSQLTIGETKALASDITNQVGKLATQKRGGDLFVFPSDHAQRAALLGLTRIVGRPIASVNPQKTNNKKGVIHIATSESEEDILAEPADQGVIQVERFHKWINNEKTPINTVALSFKDKIPTSVHIEALIFPVKIYVPTPFPCRKCWKLGHTTRYCPNTEQKCRKCGQPHDESTGCITKCTNCSSPDHPADSKFCPEYTKMQAILKIAYESDITVYEAQAKYNSLYSSTLKANHTPAP